LVIGIAGGLFNRFFVGLVSTFIFSVVLEGFLAEFVLFYRFGDSIFKIMMVSLITYTVVSLLIRLAALVFFGAAKVAVQGGSGGGFHLTDVSIIRIGHALGLFNLILFVGSILIAVLWFLRRNQPGIVKDQIKQSFFFHTSIAVIMFIIAILDSHVSVLLGLLIMPVLIYWLVMSIVGIVQSFRKGSYNYPGVSKIIKALKL
jgi:uncharacterized membrane protein